MYVLHLLMVAATAATTAGASPASTTIQWKVRGISHSLAVQTQEGDLALVDRPHTYLRSIVGPLVSTVHRRTWTGESGTYRTLAINTETQGEYPFDLVSWLDESDQSGKVLRQILEGSTCDFDGKCGTPIARWPARPQCPSADALSAYDGGFVEMSRLLIEAQCFTEEQIRLQPQSFWIDEWDGATVTLAVQRDHCGASTTACAGVVSFVRLRPPRAWNDWLENASSGKGYLARLAVPAHAEAQPEPASVPEPRAQPKAKTPAAPALPAPPPPT